jgi:hypothetical protein
MSDPRTVLRTALGCTLGTLLAAMPATSLHAADDDGSMSLQEMARRLRELESANEGLRQEVRDLKAKDGDDWLTEERSSQIRGIVTDVLADAETRASLQDSAITAGYKNGFFIASPDGAFTMKVQGLMQTRFTWGHLGGEPSAPNYPNAPDTKQDRTGWEIPTAQLTLSGTMWDQTFEYMIRTVYANDPTITLQNQAFGGGGSRIASPAIGTQAVGPYGSGSGRLGVTDAWVRANLSQDWAFRVGQFKLPFDREFLVYDAYTMLASKSVLSNHLSVGYSQGVELEYFGDDFRWKIAYSDGGTDNLGGPNIALVGTEPLNTPWYQSQADWAITSRVEFKLNGLWEEFRQFTSPRGEEFGFLVGAAVHYQQGRPWYSQGVVQGTGDDYNNWLNLTADATLNFGGASVFASFYWSNVSSGAAQVYSNSPNGFGALPSYYASSANIFGFLVQGAVYVSDEIELFAQYEYGSSTGPFNLPNSGLGGGPAPANFNVPSDLNLLTVGFNWYFHGQNAKWTTDFGIAFGGVSYFWADPAYGLRASDASNQFLLRTQWQLFF